MIPIFDHTFFPSLTRHTTIILPFIPPILNLIFHQKMTDLLLTFKLFIESSESVPFNALNNLTAECNYGGRITDNLDRRLITSMLEQFYSPSILAAEDFRFCQDPDHFIPGYSRYEDYIDYITNLPHAAHPESFGLHANALILKDHQDSQHLIDSILTTLPSRNTNNLESNQRLVV